MNAVAEYITQGHPHFLASATALLGGLMYNLCCTNRQQPIVGLDSLCLGNHPRHKAIMTKPDLVSRYRPGIHTKGFTVSEIFRTWVGYPNDSTSYSGDHL